MPILLEILPPEPGAALPPEGVPGGEAPLTEEVETGAAEFMSKDGHMIRVKFTDSGIEEWVPIERVRMDGWSAPELPSGNPVDPEPPSGGGPPPLPGGDPIIAI